MGSIVLVEHLPCIGEALGSRPGTKQIQKIKTKSTHEKALARHFFKEDEKMVYVEVH